MRKDISMARMNIPPIDIIVKDNGGNFTPLEAGSYRAICYGIVVTGTTYIPTFGKTATKIIFLWELPDERLMIDGEDKPRAISETYTLSLSEKANLRKMLAGWRGRDFTAEELKGFSLAKILGAPCLVSTTIMQNKQGHDFAKVASVTRLPKGMEAPKESENPLIMFDITNDACPLSEMSNLPEWIQKRIMESDEYKERTAGAGYGVEPSDDFIVVDNEEDLPFE